MRPCSRAGIRLCVRAPAHACGSVDSAGTALQVLLLDEPSTGMDPTARRRLWAALQSARHAGHTIVLTSHAMADADVLCTRVGILVNVRAPSPPYDAQGCPFRTHTCALLAAHAMRAA